MNSTTTAILTVDHPLKFMERPTPQLQTTVEQYHAVLAPDQFRELIGNIESIFSKFTAKLLEFEPGLERGHALHQMMDHELKAASQYAISCHKGCSGCCHYEVEITRNEAIVLRDAVQRGVLIDFKRLHLQAMRERRSPEWRRFGSADNRCVFLAENGACRVYDVRPSICRKHIVSTPPVNCTTDGATVSPIQVLLAEILLSAELSIDGNGFGSLPKMLESLMEETSAVRVETSSA